MKVTRTFDRPIRPTIINIALPAVCISGTYQSDTVRDMMRYQQQRLVHPTPPPPGMDGNGYYRQQKNLPSCILVQDTPIPKYGLDRRVPFFASTLRQLDILISNMSGQKYTKLAVLERMDHYSFASSALLCVPGSIRLEEKLIGEGMSRPETAESAPAIARSSL